MKNNEISPDKRKFSSKLLLQSYYNEFSKLKTVQLKIFKYSLGLLQFAKQMTDFNVICNGYVEAQSFEVVKFCFCL